MKRSLYLPRREYKVSRPTHFFFPSSSFMLCSLQPTTSKAFLDLELPMSFPYNYDPSNPTTPTGYNWELDQDTTAQVHHQQQQQEQQQQQQQQNQSTISPPIVQIQHLHPTQEIGSEVQLQQPPFQPPTIQIQERVKPSRYRFDNMNESHFQQQEQPHKTETRSSSRPPSSLRVSVDGTRSNASISAPTSTAGPSRVLHGRSARDQSHPYKRPSSGGASSTAGVRYTSELRERQSQVRPERASSSALPTIGTAMTASCPAVHIWRVTTTNNQIQRNVSGSSVGGEVSAVRETTRYALPSYPEFLWGESSYTTNVAWNMFISPEGITPIPTSHSVNTPLAPVAHLPQSLQQFQHLLPTANSPKRYNIRTDVHYDMSTNLMTAMLELPGLKKSDLKITMNRCPYSRLRQLTIRGRSRPVLPSNGHTVQERKFGEFARTLVVPLDTKVRKSLAVGIVNNENYVALRCGCDDGRRYPYLESAWRHSHRSRISRRNRHP